MSIDWLTVVAQIINFLVLVWLLQRFLYGPITQAMEAREQNIRQRLDDAAETKRQAEAEAAKLKDARDQLEAGREDLLSKARADADKLKRELDDEMREEMEKRRGAWRLELEEEEGAFVTDLRKRAVEQFYALAREALGGLAHKTLNEAIAEGFADRLADLENDSLGKLREAARHSNGAMTVESGFALSTAMKQRVTGAVREQLATDAEVDYIVNEELISGVRLRVGGQTVAWSLGSYLDRLEQRARGIIGEETTDTERRAAQ